MKEHVPQEFLVAAGPENVITDAFERGKTLEVSGSAGEFLITPLDDQGMVEGGLMRLALEGHLALGDEELPDAPESV